MGKHVSKIYAWLVNPVILPEIVQIPVVLAIFANCLDMVKDNLDLVIDLKDKEEWAILILFMILMTMMKKIILQDVKEYLFIENLVVDLKDVVDMAQIDLAVTNIKDKEDLVADLEDKGDLVADLKENKDMVKDLWGLIGIGMANAQLLVS